MACAVFITHYNPGFPNFSELTGSFRILIQFDGCNHKMAAAKWLLQNGCHRRKTQVMMAAADFQANS